MQKLPVREERRVGPDDPGEPLARSYRLVPEALVFAACPFPQVEVNPAQAVIQRRFVEVAVVVDPAPDARIEHSGQIIEGLVGSGLEAPAPDLLAHLLERRVGCRRQERDAVLAAAPLTDSFANVLPAGDRDLLRVIAEKAPASLDELAHLTDRKRSNLSHTRRAIAGYGLVRLERGERGRITPKVTHDRVELDLPLTWPRRAS